MAKPKRKLTTREKADTIWLHQHGEWHAIEAEPNSNVEQHILQTASK